MGQTSFQSSFSAASTRLPPSVYAEMADAQPKTCAGINQIIVDLLPRMSHIRPADSVTSETGRIMSGYFSLPTVL